MTKTKKTYTTIISINDSVKIIYEHIFKENLNSLPVVIHFVQCICGNYKQKFKTNDSKAKDFKGSLPGIYMAYKKIGQPKEYCFR